MPTHSEILNAVKNTLAADAVVATVIQRSESAGSSGNDQLGEGVNDTPLLQVYWNASDPNEGGTTAKMTYGKAGIRPSAVHKAMVTINVYVYVAQRANFGQDVNQCMTVADAIYNALEKQERDPFFGLTGCRELAWRAEYATLRYGNPEIAYAGILFTLNIWIY